MPHESDDDRREQRRRQILSVAKEVFAEFGYHNASIGEIISRAAIARGTFYLYFQSKQSVFDSILDEALRELRARITEIDVDDPAADPPQVQLRHNLLRVLDYVLGDRPLTHMLLNHREDPRAEVAERVQVFFADVAVLITSSLQHGIEMKLVRPCNTALVAWGLLGAARGMIEFCLSAGQPPSVEEIADEIIAFALRGVFVGER
ncbi:MAG: TetR/AcrR family transcriptional regulator [Proteobacteria bacterium]|nr:TetR/AcrR family transcriptional regulator [Pseudomonadota bacterium]